MTISTNDLRSTSKLLFDLANENGVDRTLRANLLVAAASMTMALELRELGVRVAELQQYLDEQAGNGPATGK